MRDEAFEGVAGDIVKLLEPHLEVNREAILANVLVLAGVLFQREAYFLVNADRHYPFDYALLVGNSAVGRKGTTTNQVIEIMEHVTPGFRDDVLRGMSPGQGLVKAIALRCGPIAATSDSEGTATVVEANRGFFAEITEFAELLAVMRREESTLSAILRQIWEGIRVAVLTRKEPLDVQNASLSCIAHVTKIELLNKLDSTEKANGFANRWMFFCSKMVKLLPQGKTSHLNFNPIVIKLHAALNSAKNVGQMERDAEAEVLWADASVSFIFGKATAVDQATEKIMRALADGPLTEDEINTRAFSKHQRSDWIAAKMLALKDAGRVRRVQKSFDKRTKEAWEKLSA